MKPSRLPAVGVVLLLAAWLASPQAGHSQEFTLGARLLARADAIFQQARRVHYCHRQVPADQQVRAVEGGLAVESDCSGFVSHLLHEVAPAQYEAVRRTAPRFRHPVSATYVRFMRSLPEGEARDGWMRISHWSALRPGDIVAWEKENATPGRGNSGHIAIVASPPGPRETATVRGRTVLFVALDVIDSSSVEHFAPQQLPPLAGQQRRDGLGRGRIRLVVDARDRAIGYWEGTWSGERRRAIVAPSYTRLIALARLLP